MQQEDKEASGDEDAADGDSVGGLATPASQGPVDALRFGAEGGKESAFFQDSGAVPTKLEQEEREVGVCACVRVSVCYTCFLLMLEVVLFSCTLRERLFVVGDRVG